jgi:ABC-type phosphate transport system substrate-binding protein
MNPRHSPTAHDSMSRKLTRRGVLRATLSALAVCLFGSNRALGDAQADGFVVIVNAQNPLSSTSREFLGDIFLKKISRWEDGEVTRPVDLSPDSPIRRAFSSAVLGRSVAAVRHYWQQRIFSGRDVPPAELDSEDAVLRYVAKYRGAVGYVSASAKLTGLKALSVR